jgi:hypothetical protein
LWGEYIIIFLVNSNQSSSSKHNERRRKGWGEMEVERKKSFYNGYNAMSDGIGTCAR